MPRSYHTSKNMLLVFSRRKYCYFGIAFTFVLLSTLISLFLKDDNIQAPSIEAYAETLGASLIANDQFIKTTVDTISSNSNNDYSPFSSNMTLPPRIVMVYNETEHPGLLLSYKYRKGYTFGQLDIPAKNITALLPSDVVNIKKGSSVEFLAKGVPLLVPPTSLSIDAYSSQGKPISVLNLTQATSSVITLDLAKGKYILLATATWIPGSQDVTGYAIFSYMINVVP